MSPAAPDLDAMGLRAAEAWIGWWSDELARQGRGMSGGWPGTMSEARARASEFFRVEQGVEISPEQLEVLARATYGAARKRWLSRVARG